MYGEQKNIIFHGGDIVEKTFTSTIGLPSFHVQEENIKNMLIDMFEYTPDTYLVSQRTVFQERKRGPLNKDVVFKDLPYQVLDDMVKFSDIYKHHIIKHGKYFDFAGSQGNPKTDSLIKRKMLGILATFDMIEKSTNTIISHDDGKPYYVDIADVEREKNIIFYLRNFLFLFLFTLAQKRLMKLRDSKI